MKIQSLAIIFIIIILLNIFYSKFIMKDDLIKIFGKSFLVVISGSMEPNIKIGELIIISESENYEKGDIITYKDKNNCYITHRIIDINEKNIITKGDSNNIIDEKNSNYNIKGKVIYHSKILGFFTMYLLKPLVIIYIILFISLNFIICKKEGKYIEKDTDIKNIA